MEVICPILLIKSYKKHRQTGSHGVLHQSNIYWHLETV